MEFVVNTNINGRNGSHFRFCCILRKQKTHFCGWQMWKSAAYLFLEKKYNCKGFYYLWSELVCLVFFTSAKYCEIVYCRLNPKNLNTILSNPITSGKVGTRCFYFFLSIKQKLYLLFVIYSMSLTNWLQWYYICNILHLRKAPSTQFLIQDKKKATSSTIIVFCQLY